MQSIWKGAVSFGLVSIPVKLYAATSEKSISFNQVHRADGGRIRYKRVCSIDGEEVPYADIAKGYELPDGEMVVLDDDDFADLPLTTSRSIEVEQFVPLDQIDPLYINRSYYLGAEGPGVKPYVLLRDALERTGRVAVVKVALRNREALAMLRVRGEALVLHTMLWPDEIRDAGGVAPPADVDVRPQEVAMAESYIETLTGEFDPEEHTDRYREALEEVIAAKVAGREVVAPEPVAADSGTVVDLMEALRRSVEAARSARGEGGAAAEEPAAARTAPGGKKAAAAEQPAAKPAKRAAGKGPAKSAPKSPAKSPARSTAKTPAKSPAKTPAKSPAKSASARASTAATKKAARPAARRSA